MKGCEGFCLVEGAVEETVKNQWAVRSRRKCLEVSSRGHTGITQRTLYNRPCAHAHRLTALASEGAPDQPFQGMLLYKDD